jgi:hypothetical protein
MNGSSKNNQSTFNFDGEEEIEKIPDKIGHAEKWIKF